MINRRCLSCLAFAVVCGFYASVACSQPYVFATFEGASGARPFAFLNASGGPSSPRGYFGISGVPITFRFTDVTGLSTADYAATLSIGSELGTATHEPATVTADSSYDQPIRGTLDRMFITDNATEKSLYVSDFSGDIIGKPGATTAVLSGSFDFPYDLGFSDFGAPHVDNFSFALSSITPGLSLDTAGVLNSFTADFSGSLSGNSAPEPTSLGLIGLISVTLLRRRKVSPCGPGRIIDLICSYLPWRRYSTAIQTTRATTTSHLMALTARSSPSRVGPNLNERGGLGGSVRRSG